MPEEIFSLSTLIGTIWTALNGGSYNLAGGMQTLGAGLWSVMCVWAFASEALDLAAGKGTNLPGLLLKWGLVGAVLVYWPEASTALYDAAKTLTAPGSGMPNLRDLYVAFTQGYRQMQELDAAAAASQIPLGGVVSQLAAIPAAMTMNLHSAIGGLVCLMCYAIVIISLAGTFMIFAMYLVMGPVFIPLAMTEAFSSFFYKWVGVVFSFFLVIPLYGGALCVIFAILGGSVPNLQNYTALPSLEHVFQLAIGPLLSVGLILGVNRIASSLTGSYFGQAGSMAFSIGAAAAGIGGRAALGAAAPAAAPAAAGGTAASAVTAATGGAASAGAAARSATGN